MRRVCAWCQKELAAGDDLADPVVSHGICVVCAEEFETDDGSLRSLLDRLGVPVVAVDQGGRLVTGSQDACAMLGRTGEELRGMTGGDAFACSHARLPGGCGRTVHCRTCTVRQTVMRTHQTGVSCRGVVAHQDRVGPGGTVPMEYRISTERVGKVVLLRIDGARPVTAPTPEALLAQAGEEPGT